MKWGLLSIGLLAVVFLAACGGNNNTTTQQTTSPNGTYTAVLKSTSSGQQTLGWNFTMMQGSNSTLAMSNMAFTLQNACFGPNSVMSGQFSGSMMSGGMMNTTMEMWSNPDRTGNHLVMNVNMSSSMNGGAMGGTGTYTLTGVTSGCTSDTGTMTMTRM